MRNALTAALLAATVLAGCSEQPSERPAEAASAADEASAAASDALAESAPNVGPTAAPGVAFTYQYGFRLADNQIAPIQEKHAAACEVLGITRCRITGMRYERAREDQVDGQLDFALDPAIARKFGREAIASVEAAEGVLASAMITGDDVGTTITASQRRSAELSAELTRIETRLAQPGLADRERRELQEQAAGLRARLTEQRDERRVGEAQLALTPMTFAYSGTGGLPGIGYGNPFADALTVLLRSGSTLLWFLLTALAGGLPWLLLAALLLFGWRSAAGKTLRDWWTKSAGSPPA